MNRLFNVSRRHEHGFSLIEVVISIGVLAIILPALVFALATGVKVLSMTDVRETARDMAEAQMENIQSQPYDDTNNPPEYTTLPSESGGFAITVDPIRIDRGTGTDNDTGIQHISILVTRDGAEVFRLDGQKVKW